MGESEMERREVMLSKQRDENWIWRRVYCV